MNTLFYGDSLTIKDLLNGKRPEMPPVGANVTFQIPTTCRDEQAVGIHLQALVETDKLSESISNHLSRWTSP